MKTLLFVLALALTVSMTGFASNVTSPTANKTEMTAASKTTATKSEKKGQKKKPHGKKHHKATSAKKAPAAKK
ncbi:MAG TPA: hypothetical protein DCL77_12375 [Prolixibacteraceae bacterium]|nr:hypothetical protein [Prolixibacteraceae bacterium]